MKENFGQQPEKPKHNAPEVGAGPLGTSPPGPGEPKPQQEGAANLPGEKRIEWGSYERVVFDCAVPEVIPSPFHIQRMLREEILTEEQAQELEQQWLGKLRTMDRRDLEEEANWWESMRGRFTEEQKLEEVQEIEQQLDVIREQLRQRELE